ncbi:hypothetical protein LTR17_002555 [Elasticomyces elasticus]|nr:hypothetical protein LTR17_002555 [Elasticomyces elasticus]
MADRGGPTPEPRKTPPPPISRKRGSTVGTMSPEKASGEDAEAFRRLGSYFRRLLEAESSGTPVAAPPMPPFKDPGERYTATEYANKALYILYRRNSRRTSPFTKILMKNWSDALNVALRKSGEKEMNELFSVETMVQMRKDVYIDLSDDEIEYANAIAELKRMSIWSRYGDYIGKEAKRLRSILMDKEESAALVANVFKIQETGTMKLWTEVVDDLGSHGVLKKGLERACNALGLEYDDVVIAFEQYAARNKKMHNNLIEYLRSSDWPALAKLIANDLLAVRRLVQNQDEARVIKTAITEFRDKYLEWDPSVNHGSGGWEPNAAAGEWTKEMARKRDAQKQSATPSAPKTNEKKEAMFEHMKKLKVENEELTSKNKALEEAMEALKGTHDEELNALQQKNTELLSTIADLQEKLGNGELRRERNGEIVRNSE